MSKYIEAEKLKRYLTELREIACRNHADQHWLVPKTLTKIKQYIDSLQQEQPEADLEKFISDFFDKKDAENNGRWSEDDIVEAITKAYELGKSGKEEKL